MFIKKLLNKKLYEALKKIYNFFSNIRYKNYNLSNDYKFNEKLFSDLNIDVDQIKLELKKNNYDYYHNHLSWHYHIFTGLSFLLKKNNKKIKNILEIGTFNGNFTNFISKIYKESNIVTIDLGQEDKNFINTYNRHEANYLREFLEKRKNNIDKQNINFIEVNSTLIKEKFKNYKFDLIWIDGDHRNPQVTIDIINAYDLLNPGGIFCVDDIIIKKFYHRKPPEGVSSESFETLKLLEDNKLIKNYFFIKRMYLKNKIMKKFISLSFKN